MIDSHLNEWLNLVVRFVHVVTGIAWIGASFYFNWLENSLNRKENLRDELAGNLWAVHGGGFYYLEKYKEAPAELPKTLHWFKWEAYFTWMSGFLLLGTVYYLNAKTYLIDPNVADLSPFQAIGISLAVIVGGWVVYDRLCKTRLVSRNLWFAAIVFVFTIGTAFVLSNLFSGRGAYIHIGAMLGTIMAANVFFVIIPSQKELVAAASEKRTLDPELGEKAGLRSLHNNYFTLPVVFIMISNHFPSTFGNKYNWAVMAALFVLGVLIRHDFNVKGKIGKRTSWIMPTAVLGLVGLVFVTKPKSTSIDRVVSYVDVAPIIQKHCQNCHSKTPTFPGMLAPPKDITYDSYDEIVVRADQIKAQAVTTNVMPLGNVTQITDEERALLGTWIDSGHPK